MSSIVVSPFHGLTPPPDFNPQVDSLYHYVPTQWICGVFLCLFISITVVHFLEAFYFRLWFLIPTAVVAGIGEVIGWAARYWSSQNYGMLQTPYMIQISTTIIAPTPLLAAYFVILGRLIDVLGPAYSRLSPMLYTIVFVTADVVALVVQAVGGGIASNFTPSSTKLGGNIMLGGIAIQFGFLCVFVILAIEFFIRLLFDRPVRAIRLTNRRLRYISGGLNYELGAIDSSRAFEAMKADRRVTLSRKTRWFLRGMALSLACLFIRAIYRLIELSDGWDGPIISTQWYFNGFDGAMVVLAMVSLNVLHPGFLLTL